MDIKLGQLPSLPLTERLRLPECPAIYFAIADDGEVLYIGRTKSLARRWSSHRRRPQLETINSVRIAWLSFENVNALVELERALIEQFKPSLNGALMVPRVDPTPKVHVYLVVPRSLHEWLRSEASAGGLKNVQEKILQVLRTAQDSEQEQVA